MVRHDDTIKYYYVDGNATQAGPVFLPDLQNMCARANPGTAPKLSAQASPAPKPHPCRPRAVADMAAGSRTSCYLGRTHRKPSST